MNNKWFFIAVFSTILFALSSCSDNTSNSETSEPPLSETNMLQQTENSHLPPMPKVEAENSRTLQKNWNLVSFPVNQISNLSTLMQSGGQYNNIQSVWKWDSSLGESGNWKVYPQTSDFDLLAQVTPDEGYWIQARASFDFSGDVSIENAYTFAEGWNLIGYSHSSSEVLISDFFSEGDYWKDTCETTEPVISAWAWVDNTWQVYFPDDANRTVFNNTHGTNFEAISNLKPGMGLWVNADRSNLPPSTEPCSTPETVNISLNSDINGSVTGLASGQTTSVTKGSIITLVASPGTGKVLTGWDGVTCSNPGLTCSFVAGQDMTITPIFADTHLFLTSDKAQLIEGTQYAESATITSLLNGYSGDDLSFDLSNSSDRTTLSVSSIVIPSNSLTAAPFTVTTIPNSIVNITETVTILAQSGFIASSVALVLHDDDLPSVYLTSDVSTIAENGGTVTVTAVTDVNNVYPNTSVTVLLSATGSATSGSDYSAFATLQTIPSGATTTSFTITATDDGLTEGDESLILSISNVNPLVALPGASLTISIIDDE